MEVIVGLVIPMFLFALVFGEFVTQQHQVFVIIGHNHSHQMSPVQFSIQKNQVRSSFKLISFNFVFSGFIRSAQGLEIVSLIFYVFAVLFIIVGFLNIRAFPYQVSFGVAAGLLFLASKTIENEMKY